ncbi:MAG: hypothetical protein H8K07_06315 [Nitrospira sp.]|jgi:hypothetical protein|nr:hypothetical protein [Nitrospira sp.]
MIRHQNGLTASSFSRAIRRRLEHRRGFVGGERERSISIAMSRHSKKNATMKGATISQVAISRDKNFMVSHLLS